MMARDPVETLLRLRRLTVDEARRDLGECLQQEATAEAAAHAIKAAIMRETAEACRLDADDHAVEAFAAWLKRIRPSAQAADEAWETAVVRTTEARAVLAAARAAAEATEGVLERQEAERAAVLAREEQRALDEAGGAGRAERGGGAGPASANGC